MSINFEPSCRIESFLGDPREKYVLALDKNSLNIIPLSQTFFFDRVKAWFGFGPLSLNRIAQFISQHNEEINNCLIIGRIQEDFYKKLTGKCLAYNSHHRHLFSRIPNSTLAALQKHVPLCSVASFSKDQTYHSTLELGNVDFSYANKKLGFGYIIDGAGHDNIHMAMVLNKMLTGFNKSYKNALRSQTFDTVESARQFLADELNKLANTLASNRRIIDPNGSTFEDRGYHPAMSFAQTIKIGSQYHLLSAELSDTMLIIKKANGTFDTSLIEKREDLGLGSGTINVKVTPLARGDTIIGFSDGVGEFLTLKECKEIILKIHPLDLLTASRLLAIFKNKIIEKGEEFTARSNNEGREEKIQSANHSNYIKYHTFDRKDRHDDIGMFTLTVSV